VVGGLHLQPLRLGGHQDLPSQCRRLPSPLVTHSARPPPAPPPSHPSHPSHLSSRARRPRHDESIENAFKITTSEHELLPENDLPTGEEQPALYMYIYSNMGGSSDEDCARRGERRRRGGAPARRTRGAGAPAGRRRGRRGWPPRWPDGPARRRLSVSLALCVSVCVSVSLCLCVSLCVSLTLPLRVFVSLYLSLTETLCLTSVRRQLPPPPPTLA
jgi:hypothetical protein